MANSKGSSGKKILVATSTGTVGKLLVEQLVEAREQVRAGTRDPAKVARANGVEPVRLDLRDRSTFAGALEGVDRVFLLSPAGELSHYDLLIPFVEAALAGGQRKIVLMTASGVEYDDRVPLRQVELFIEKSGAPYVILRPTWFLDNFHTFWRGPIVNAGVLPIPAGDSRTAFIDARDIAASAVAALRSDRFDRQAFTLTGPKALTYAEAAAVLSEVSGRPIQYVNVDDAAFIQGAVQAGLSEAYAQYLAALFGFVRQGAAAQVSADVTTLTGRAPRTLAQYARDHKDAWKA
ncbi:SDR family oxidoreductase [Sorangium sp. So ce1024]|uniref:SDR family oxidoreductase n=1 Tax=unclassified Sorangium TaxID=2621164 RepID=UPI003F0BE95D